MKHYGAELEAGSQIVSGNLAVNAGQDVTLSSTSILNIGAPNVGNADTGLIIASTATNAYLDAMGRERLFSLDSATEGIQALRVNSTLGVDGATVFGDNDITIPVFGTTLSGGNFLGLDSNGKLGFLAANTFSVLAFTGTGATDAIVKADFISAFNSAGTSVGGITVPVGTTLDTGDIILLTNGAATPTVEQYIYTGPNRVASALSTDNVIIDAEVVDISHASDVVENITGGAGILTSGTPANEVISIALSADPGLALVGVGNAATLEALVDPAGALEKVAAGLDVKDAGIDAARIATDAVTTVKILDANVTTAKIADNAITTAKILDGNVTGAKLADNSVSEVKLNISNAPVANQFLQVSAVNAGVATLTWAAPAGTVGKYTAIHATNAGANPTITILATTHGRGVRAGGFVVQVQEDATSATVVIPDDIAIAVNGDVTITFGAAALGAIDFRVTIVG